MRLDRLLGQHPTWGRQRIRSLLVRGCIQVDNKTVKDGTTDISPFHTITIDGQLFRQGKQPIYLMLHKPEGILSATSDPVHKTVMDLLPDTITDGLHIGGRLDKASTGLLLLTNDGQWSGRLTRPERIKPKVYKVQTGKAIHPDTQKRFAEGIYFPFEDLTTRPVKLEQLSEREARLTLYEGRYHQIKRMFGRFRNPVIGLHRESMGDITLDASLAPGDYRILTPEEVASV